MILKEGGGIGRILMIEFGEQDSSAFDEVMDVLKRHPDFDYQQLNEDSVLSIPGLEIYPNRRKIYRGRKEINLTVKEYDLFYLLVVNQGHVLTYNQIYQKIWGEDALGNEISGTCGISCMLPCRMPLSQSDARGRSDTVLK